LSLDDLNRAKEVVIVVESCTAKCLDFIRNIGHLKRMPKPRAVLFDFDGVIADTAMDFLKAWRFCLEPFGVNFKDEDCLLLEGKKGIEIAQGLLKACGLPTDQAKALKISKDHYYSKYNSFRIYPGVEDLVNELTKRGIKTAIVSGGLGPRNVPDEFVPFISKFDLIVTGDEVKAAKPDPELFLSAARKLGIPTSECTAIENAPLGIQSAKAAKIFCIALKTTLAETYLKEADLVLNDIVEVKDYLLKNI